MGDAPLQVPPRQPTKLKVFPGVAVKLRGVRLAGMVMGPQFALQSMLLSAATTFPVWPARPTMLTVTLMVFATNTAPAVLLLSMVNEQSAFPLQSPLQPMNVEMASGVAVSVTIWKVPASVLA